MSSTQMEFFHLEDTFYIFKGKESSNAKNREELIQVPQQRIRDQEIFTQSIKWP